MAFPKSIRNKKTRKSQLTDGNKIANTTVLKIRVSLVRFRLRALVTDGGMVALADRTTRGQRARL